jgi:hypothetical protein
MGYYEKLIWGQFLPLVLGFGYFVAAASHGSWPLLPAVFLFVMAQAIYFVLLAALSRKEPRDERVRLIELKSFKVSYLVVMCLVCFWVGGTVLHMIDVPHRMAVAVWLAVWYGIESVRTGTQVALYRASVRA